MIFEGFSVADEYNWIK